MENIFSNIRHHSGDVYVADYTQYAKSHPESPMKGVTISDVRPPLIGSLAFENPNAVRLMSVNFEENQYFFRPIGEHRTVSNCECMLVSEDGAKKRWIVLAELKYCKGEDRNIASNFSKALSQLEETFLYLVDEKKIFATSDYRFYWVVSIPEHSEKAPFSAFFLSQDDELQYKEKYNSIIISDNVARIWTGSVILKPRY